jgi:hypothetical protein
MEDTNSAVRLFAILLTVRRDNRKRFLEEATMLPPRREDRRSLRRLTRRDAEITFSAQASPVRCVIWDMSDGGARLSVAHPLADLPRMFTLALFKDASVRRNCEVVWTDTKYVGVKFISEWYGNTRSGLRSNGHDARRI